MHYNRSAASDRSRRLFSLLYILFVIVRKAQVLAAPSVSALCHSKPWLWQWGSMQHTRIWIQFSDHFFHDVHLCFTCCGNSSLETFLLKFDFVSWVIVFVNFFASAYNTMVHHCSGSTDWPLMKRSVVSSVVKILNPKLPLMDVTPECMYEYFVWMCDWVDKCGKYWKVLWVVVKT